jgi:transposase-like protein
MKKNKNEIYMLVDEKYLSKFSFNHHCEFCWEKFGEENGVLHIGYCTCDRYRWICEQCYNDFKELFDWKLVDEKTITSK